VGFPLLWDITQRTLVVTDFERQPKGTNIHSSALQVTAICSYNSTSRNIQDEPPYILHGARSLKLWITVTIVFFRPRIYMYTWKVTELVKQWQGRDGFLKIDNLFENCFGKDEWYSWFIRRRCSYVLVV